MQDLKGKIALITGIANKRSIAFAIAEAFSARGVKLVVAYQPLGKDTDEAKITKLTESLKPEMILPLDVTDGEMIADLFAQVGEKFGKLDILIHCIAGAKRDELSGKFTEISEEGFLMAQKISAFSLIALTKGARDLLKVDGGSVIALTYIGATRVSKNYNVMGAAKASLEANTRYLAMELGEENIRVNAISAGPIRTLSASGVRDFLDLLHQAAEFSALKRNITREEVAQTASFLASSQSSGITGQVLFVDGGFNIFG